MTASGADATVYVYVRIRVHIWRISDPETDIYSTVASAPTLQAPCMRRDSD